jgi:anti-sigma regulatory factor (Ser/Thr protein kinase)
VASLELSPDYSAAAKARHFVADTMRAWGCDDAIPDAELLVSELVTNAVLHARSATRVTIERDGATLRFSVYDSSATRPRLRAYGPEAVTGRGLLLVDRIARRWGVEPDGDGKCVWFEVRTQRRHAEGRAAASEP